MSNFNYKPEKIEHYAPLMIAHIENNPKGSNPISEGYIKAIDGNDYKIDLNFWIYASDVILIIRHQAGMR